MRCLYCGEKLGKPADAENAFCSTAHRMLFQWHSKPSNGNGHHAPGIIELVSRAEQGETVLAAARPLNFPPMDFTFEMRHPLAEPLAYPRVAALVRAAIALDSSSLLLGGEVWALPPSPGNRKPRPLRGPGFIHLSASRMLPRRAADPEPAMPLGKPADLARSTSKNRPYLQPKTDKPLTISTARARAVMLSLRNQLSVTDIEPPKPPVADLRRKVASARTAMEAGDVFQTLDFPDPVAPGLAKISAPLGAIPPAVDVAGIDMLGGQCVRQHLSAVRLGGSDTWTPGPVAFDPPFQPRPCDAKIDAAAHPVLAFPAEELPLAAELAPLGCTAFFQNDRVYAGVLRPAPELPVEWVAPPVECELAGRPVAAYETIESGPVVPRVPSSEPEAAGLALPRPGLASVPDLDLLAPPLPMFAGEPAFAAAADAPPRPAVPALAVNAPLGVGLTLERGHGLFPVTPGVSAPPSAGLRAVDSTFLPPQPVAPKPEGPRMGLSKHLAPPMARVLARYAPQAIVIPHDGSSFAKPELVPLNSDPIRMTPRLRVRLTQDEAVSEAVRQFKAVHGTSFLRSIQDTLPTLKSIQIPSRGTFSIFQGRMKWALAAVPVLVAAGYFSMRAPEAAPPVTATAEVTPAVEPATAPVSAPQPEAQAPAVAVAPIPAANPAATPTPVAAQQSAEPADGAPQEGFMGTVRTAILKRAAISLADDFRSGLGDWQGSGQWSRQWSYDAAGFLNTGPSVVLYGPSMKLTNYRVDFLGQIERRSLGWVFRAADHRNYHAGKITLTRNGPLPRAVVEHYAVVNGRADRHQSRPLPIEIRSDTMYRVRMDVSGSDFTLSVQGQIVDHWSDNRHPSGGVGFFSDRGEQSRLRWVEVTHQADWIGKLCAFLAPYSLPAREGNQKQ